MKNFVASYSGGKDSILAIDKAIAAGYQPSQLITTFNPDKQRSWFHGLTSPILQLVENSMQIPIQKIVTTATTYSENFEVGLAEAWQLGAKICVFGDIDIISHLQWCITRCDNVGIKPYFPLWNKNRKELVHEFINLGYKARITIVNTTLLDARFLGELLTHQLVDEIEASGADPCGENGEYHTFVYDGPLFNKPLAIKYLEKIEQGEYVILPYEPL